MISLLQRGDSWADIDDNSGALMSQDRRKCPFGIGSASSELIGMANPGGLQLDQYLSLREDQRVPPLRC